MIRRTFALLTTTLLSVAGCGGASSDAKGAAAPTTVASSDHPLPRLHGPKKRIAIVDFEDVTGHGLAAAAREAATDSLHNSGAFIVVEREALAATLKEQGLAQAGVISPSTGAAAGKVLGLQGILTGKVTDFADENNTTHVFMVNKRERVAHARVSLRMTDATTGETWVAESGEGTASETGTTVYGQGGDTRDQNLGKNALYAAVQQMLGKILAKVDNTPWSSNVAKANLGTGMVYITAGSDVGLPSGSLLKVKHVGDEITDPSTGQVIGHELGKDVGQLQVDSDLNEKVTACHIASGKDFTPGDVVTLSQ